MDVSKNRGVFQNRWFIMENPIRMDDLGGTTIFGNIHDCFFLQVHPMENLTAGSLVHLKITSMEGKHKPLNQTSMTLGSKREFSRVEFYLQASSSHGLFLVYSVIQHQLI